MEKVKDLDIGLVVLNAGVANFGYMDEVESIKLQEMIDTNVYQYGALLNKFSPILMKRKSKSGMITLSSIAAQFSMPQNTVYGATKVFVKYLTMSASDEMSRQEDGKKIDLLSL